MNKRITFPKSLIGLTLITLLVLPFLLGAEERSTGSTQVDSEALPTAGYNNTRSNKSNIAAPEVTNICDGVTCADGSCVATADDCAVARTISPDIYAGQDEFHRSRDGGGDGLPDARTLDSDGDGILDVVERGDVTPALYERPQDPEASQVREREEVDIIGLGEEKAVVLDDCNDDDTCVYPGEQAKIEGGDVITDENDIIAPAQDYNSTRSNRRKDVFAGGPDADGDGWGWPEATLRAGAFIRLDSTEGEAAVRGDIDSSVVCWGRAEDGGGRVYSWGRGLCVLPDATTKSDGTNGDRIVALQVSGNQVRAWSEEERTGWREYRETASNNEPEERLIEHLVGITQYDERIQEIFVDDGGIEMIYRTEMRLLGIVPINRNLTTRMSTTGAVEIDYPWYSFLTTKPQRETIRNTLLDTMDILILVPKRAG